MSSPIPGPLLLSVHKDTSFCFKPRIHLNSSTSPLRDYFLIKIQARVHTRIDFLGYHCILVQGNVFLTQINFKKLEKSFQEMEISSQMTPRLLISQVEVRASLEKTIPIGHLRMCAFQRYLEKTGNICSHYL